MNQSAVGKPQNSCFIAANEMGDVNAGQQDEKYIARTNYWRYTFPAMQDPMNEDTWNAFRTEPFKWLEKVDAGEAVNPYAYQGKLPYRPAQKDE